MRLPRIITTLGIGLFFCPYLAAFTPNDDFRNFLKQVENGSKVGYKDGRWHVHDVAGVPHIGYGHKLKPKETYHDGLSDREVLELLNGDIDAAVTVCEREIVEWDSLGTTQQEMLVDYAFNLGTTRTFPKMVRAIVGNDTETMRKEYKRYAVFGGKRKELKGRNKAFHKRYLE